MTTWPSATKASTTHVDAGTDQISLARADIKQNMDNVNDIIDIFNIASPTNGDLMQYNSSTTKWEKVSANSLAQNQQLVIPFTGFVVTEAAADGFTSSSGAEARKFRQVLLGGAHYMRGSPHTGTLTAAASYYGEIAGASVTRSTPTKVTPTGYSYHVGGLTGSITNGVITNTYLPDGSQFTTNAGGNGCSVIGGQYVYYAYGYDNYVTLPAGDYSIQIRTSNTSDASWTKKHVHCNLLNTDNDTIDNMSVFNRTDQAFITPQNEEQFTPSDVSLNPATWPVNTMQVITLAGTKDIQFFNRVNPNTMGDAGQDALGIAYTGGTTSYTSGDHTPQGSSNAWRFFKNGAYIPHKLGWVTLVPNTWIVITKLS